MDSEAKQTKMVEFGAEKVLLQGKAKRTCGSCSKSPTSSIVLVEKFFLNLFIFIY